MRSLYNFAKWSGNNAEIALQKARSKASNASAMEAALTANPVVRLFKACRKNGPTCLTGEAESIFLALPERLLASLSYFIGDTKSDIGLPDQLQADTRDFLEVIKTVDIQFERLSSRQLAGFKQVLLCHGLSPVGDSLFLLADLGRAFRVSAALDVPIQVMLTDVDWQQANRSILQLPSLTEAEITSGLESSKASRLALYGNLNIGCKPFSVRVSRLKEISDFYRNLIAKFWKVVPLDGKLSIDDLKLVNSRLDETVEKAEVDNLRFIRFIAKRFNGFDEEFFWYFLNQYFAQREYRGSSFKVAVQSESKFDSAFEELDSCLSRWSQEDETDGDNGLASVYLAQYELAGLSALPYTPLSLDMMQQASVKEDHEQVFRHLIELKKGARGVRKLLKETSLLERNRLIADTLSFVTLCGITHSIEFVESVARNNDINSTEVISTLAGENAVTEMNSKDNTELVNRWKTGIAENLTGDNTGLPAHIAITLLEESDWNRTRLTAAVRLCQLAIALYGKLSS